MAGGTWTTQNKVRPGVYINTQNLPKSMGAIGERGVVTMPLVLSWGESGNVITVSAGEDTYKKLGYGLSDAKMLLIKEALKRAKTLLLYRLNTGTKATGIHEELTVTAAFGGTRGNDIRIAIQEDIDAVGEFYVTTYVEDAEVDVQKIKTLEALKDNDWVSFKGTGEVLETAGLPLTGGSDGTVTNQQYSDYLSTVEAYDFNTMALPSEDVTLKGIFVSFCKRLREDEGKKIQLVVAEHTLADYEGVISVGNGVVLSDGTTLTTAQCTAWVAGATAAAPSNASLTYTAYDEAIDVVPRLTNQETINALVSGSFVFSSNSGKAIVEQDINTLTSHTIKKGKVFSKNRVIRVLDTINNDFLRIFTNFYIGKVSNNDMGRSLLKNECINYLNLMQGIEAIQEFDPKADIEVLQGTDSDSVTINLHVRPVDSIEKIYVVITVA